MPAPLLRHHSRVAHGGVGAGEEGSDRQRSEDGDGAATGVSPLVDPAYSSWGMSRRVVNAGLQQLPGLHPGMGPAPDAVGEGLGFGVRNCNPEAVTAFLSKSCQGAKMPML